MQWLYPYPPAKTLELEHQVSEMVKHGIVSETWYAESSALVILVKKGNTGKLRLTIDFWELNMASINEIFPLPLFQSVIDLLGEAQSCFFTRLDMYSAFWQLPLKEELKKYTCFTTPLGYYHFNHVPMRINAGYGTVFCSLWGDSWWLLLWCAHCICSILMWGWQVCSWQHLNGLPFLKTGATIAVFHCAGMVPKLRVNWNMRALEQVPQPVPWRDKVRCSLGQLSCLASGFGASWELWFQSL